MKTKYKLLHIVLVLSLVVSSSCKDLTETNQNPNGVDPTTINPSFLMTNILKNVADSYCRLQRGNLSGVAQHTQQDAWSSGYNDYNWSQENWDGYYGNLRDTYTLIKRAQELNYPFVEGVGYLMKGFVYAQISDLWGDAPYTYAVQGDKSGEEYAYPVFDSQEVIYNGVIADLEKSIECFKKGSSAGVSNSADVYFAGNQTKWEKFASALIVRYAMRISTKNPAKAKELVEKYAGKVYSGTEDDARMYYPGDRTESSWPSNRVYGTESDYGRNKMCATLVYKCRELNDPRLVIWANPIEVATVVSTKYPDFITKVTEGGKEVRYINPTLFEANKAKMYNPTTYYNDRKVLNLALADSSDTYVGIPNSYINEPYNYNLNELGAQSTSRNPYVSYLRRDIFEKTNGPLLYSRLSSYTEICFTLAEAAMKGWNVGKSAKEWYEAGVRASFNEWILPEYQKSVDQFHGCVKNANDYLAQPKVAWDGTMTRLMEQKWIGSFFACHETWADYKRTGLPALKAGPYAKYNALPLRFVYGSAELQSNPAQAEAAIAKLQKTQYDTGNTNSPWAKYWLLQNGNLPW